MLSLLAIWLMGFLSHSGGLTRKKKEIGGLVEGRIARAELGYRSGQHRPIVEDDVVHAVNQLAMRFGAPEYSKTDVNQVHQLRFELSFEVPHLISSSSSEGKVISSTMSPTEAAYVTLSMIHQKLFNAKYQVSSDEWQRNRRQENAEQVVGLKSGHHGKKAGGPRLISSDPSVRTHETYEAVTYTTQFMSTEEIGAMPDSVLDDLGVSR
jgi:hypothetical protein